MRITRKNRQARMSSRPDTWVFMLAFILAFSLGGYITHLGWPDALFEAGVALLTNPRDVMAVWAERAQLPDLVVDLDFEAYQQLHAQRALALQRGANLASVADYVPSTVTYAGEQMSVDLRLPEVEAAALSGDRWPLEFAVSDGQELLGMRWATLAPAAEASSLTEIYLLLSREAGLPTAKQHAINLTVNGAHWGRYILQSLPATDMLGAQGISPESVVVWFDQRAYLEAQPDAPGYSFAYARIAVANVVGTSSESRADALNQDPALAATYADVVHSLRELELGEVQASHMFDAEQLGRFLALRTLWYGTSALDWRSVALLYDPTMQTFTPIAQGGAPEPEAFLPAKFTYDTEVWLSYVQALDTLSTFEFQETLRSPWRDLEMRLISAAQLSELRERQARAQDMLYPTRTLFAEAHIQSDVLDVRLDAILPFMVEVVGLEIGERSFVALDRGWVEADALSALVPAADAVVLHARLGASPVALSFSVPLMSLPVPLHGMADELHLVTRIWGLDEQIRVPVMWRKW